jgi:hypothetical protein
LQSLTTSDQSPCAQLSWFYGQTNDLNWLQDKDIHSALTPSQAVAGGLLTGVADDLSREALDFPVRLV